MTKIRNTVQQATYSYSCILYLRCQCIIYSILLAELNKFVLLVFGCICHTNFAQFMCRVVNISAVCGFEGQLSYISGARQQKCSTKVKNSTVHFASRICDNLPINIFISEEQNDTKSFKKDLKNYPFKRPILQKNIVYFVFKGKVNKWAVLQLYYVFLTLKMSLKIFRQVYFICLNKVYYFQ